MRFLEFNGFWNTMCPKETRIVVQCDETTLTIIIFYHSYSHLELYIMHNLRLQSYIFLFLHFR